MFTIGAAIFIVLAVIRKDVYSYVLINDFSVSRLKIILLMAS